jgi:hypothetical protein
MQVESLAPYGGSMKHLHAPIRYGGVGALHRGQAGVAGVEGDKDHIRPPLVEEEAIDTVQHPAPDALSTVQPRCIRIVGLPGGVKHVQ